MLSFSQEKKYTTYRVTDNETITSIAKKLGVTPFNLLQLNPDAKNGIDIDQVIVIPNKKYQPTIPLKAHKIIVKKLSFKDSIKDGILYHKVKVGETIYSLARKYKIKKKKLLKFNNLKRRSKISINQVLKFPTNKADTFVKKPVIVAEINPKETQKEFLDYTVKAADTKYSLAKKHHISVTELEKINPHLKGKTLNEYDEIVLPNAAFIKNLEIISKETAQKYKSHTVQPQETFFKLIELYHITKEELIAINPTLKEGLKAGMTLKIPKVNNAVLEESKYKTHTVLPLETMYSLTNLYTISEEKLIAINPDLKEGLKAGMTLKIPNKTNLDKLLNLDTNFSGKTIKVSLLLPFKAKQKANITFEKDKNINRITDFYLGALLAMENLKQKGLSITLNVFDTKKDTATIAHIINTQNFAATNVIIGPLYYSNIAKIAKIFKNTNVPVISPVAKNAHQLLQAKNIIQNVASKTQLQNRMLNFIKDNYTNQNIIVITDEKETSKFKVAQLTGFLKLNDSITKVTVLNMEDGYIKREKFIENISNKKENWVIIASKNNATTFITVDNLGVFTKDYKITLFALDKGKNFNNIKNSFLNRLNFHYPTNEFIDNQNSKVLAFKTTYKLKYGNAPSNFSYKGYDTTYDALLRIATYKNIDDSFQEGKTKGLSCDFNYKSNMYCPINDNIFIVKYQDFEVVKVE